MMLNREPRGAGFAPTAEDAVLTDLWPRKRHRGPHRRYLLHSITTPWRALLAIAFSLILCFQGVADEKRRPPNIILILADDLGYGDLSCFGAKDIQTPNIDRLAAGGMRLTRFYANSSVCSPTRAALLTGRFPELVGVPGVVRTHPENSWGRLSPDAILLPSVLKRAGYHTVIVGKWHLGLASPNTPTERGFDFFHGFLGDMMDDYYNHRRHGQNYMRRNGAEIDPKGHATDLFTQWAVDYVRERSATKQPFFL
jgi:arylsulfatase A-like enzyme